MGRGILSRATLVDHSVLTSLFGFPVGVVLFLLMITWTELTGKDHSTWIGSSPASCGGRGCWMLWMGNHGTCCTPGLALVHGLEVIDHGALVLALLSGPRAVGYAAKVAKGIQVMYPHQSHNLRRFRRGNHTKKPQTFG